MFFKTVAAAAVVAAGVAAEGRPSNTSICDYYTTALLMNNTAANQNTLLTLVVNTAVIGNCMFTFPQLRSFLYLTCRRHQAKCRHYGPRYPRQGHVQRH